MSIDSQTILTMIENVDPKDTATLDEIDCLTHLYLGYFWHGDLEPHENGAGHWGLMKGCHCVNEDYFAPDCRHYSTSIDAQEAIDTQGCLVDLYQQNNKEFSCSLYYHIDIQLYSPHLPTRPLALLHALVQLTEWKRNNE